MFLGEVLPRVRSKLVELSFRSHKKRGSIFMVKLQLKQSYITEY